MIRNVTSKLDSTPWKSDERFLYRIDELWDNYCVGIATYTETDSKKLNPLNIRIFRDEIERNRIYIFLIDVFHSALIEVSLAKLKTNDEYAGNNPAIYNNGLPTTWEEFTPHIAKDHRKVEKWDNKVIYYIPQIANLPGHETQQMKYNIPYHIQLSKPSLLHTINPQNTNKNKNKRLNIIQHNENYILDRMKNIHSSQKHKLELYNRVTSDKNQMILNNTLQQQQKRFPENKIQFDNQSLPPFKNITSSHSQNIITPPKPIHSDRFARPNNYQIATINTQD